MGDCQPELPGLPLLPSPLKKKIFSQGGVRVQRPRPRVGDCQPEMPGLPLLPSPLKKKIFSQGGVRGQRPRPRVGDCQPELPGLPLLPSPLKKKIFSQGGVRVQRPRPRVGDCQPEMTGLPLPPSPLKKKFFSQGGVRGQSAPAKGGRLPAGVARSAPTPISPEKNFFFCVLLKSSMRVDLESGTRVPRPRVGDCQPELPGLPLLPSPLKKKKNFPRGSQGPEASAKGGRLPAGVARSAPSPISPLGKIFFPRGSQGPECPGQGWETASPAVPLLPSTAGIDAAGELLYLQRWRHLLQEHFFPIGEQVTKASSVAGSQC